MGYHLRKIHKGKFGEISKISEELEELIDSKEQNSKIMMSVELSDLYGAIREFAKKELNLSMKDLEVMADITQRAFEDGTRK